MKEEKLLINIIDQIKEAQIKLGAASETIRLYFPMSSLNQILETEYDDETIFLKELRENHSFEHTVLGHIKFFARDERFEVRIPPEGADYVAANVPDPAFLVALIRAFEDNHHLSIDEICEIFAAFDPDYICETMDPGTDFDYSIHFSDIGIDAYYYCIKMEMGHTIYHRFTEADYEALLV